MKNSFFAFSEPKPSPIKPESNIIALRTKSKLRNYLIQQNEDQLRSFLKDSELLNGLKKEKLIDLILVSADALKKSTFQARKEELTKKTVLQLRNLLKGQEKISRLRKSELIERVLLLEQATD